VKHKRKGRLVRGAADQEKSEDLGLSEGQKGEKIFKVVVAPASETTPRPTAPLLSGYAYKMGSARRLVGIGQRDGAHKGRR
jgi:hypothetical protein